MPELLTTFKAMQKTEEEKRTFLAMLQGVDLRDKSEEKEGSTFEEVQMRAMGINANKDDVMSLQGSLAAQAGFGIGMGLGYSKE